MSEPLPSSWAYTRLDQIAVVVAGNPAPQGSEYFNNGEFNFVRVHDMGVNGNNTFLTKTRDLINDTAIAKMRLIPANSVLFTKSGASTLLNQRAILAKDSYVVSHIAAAIPSKGVKSKWLFYFLQLVDFATLAHATNMPSLPLSRAKAIIVPIATTTEQAGIVAKIEELFSELDKGVESLKTARAQLNVYRQVVLKHAFEGKLTAQWREENKDKLETPEQLLARIKQEREARYERQLDEWKSAVKTWEETGKPGKKPTKPKKPRSISHLSHDVLDSLPEIPDGWTWVKLEDVCNRITDGEHFRPPVTNEGVYFLSAKDVREDGVRFDDPLYISNKTAEKALARCNPEYGDLLVVSRGATVGRTCVVRTYEQFCLLGSVILIKPGEVLDNLYLSFFLRSSRVNEILVRLSGSTAQQAIYLRDIKGLNIPVCSLSEQQEIVRLLDGRFAVLEQQEREIDLALKQAETLRQAILKKAFAGQLVPQDPYDEPASVLLDRIRTEREKVMQNNHSKKTKKRKTTA